MTNDLIARYIYAVTKQMSKANAVDVSAELQTLIDDMLAEQCDGEPTPEAIRAVLTQLGDPQAMYEKYDADGKKTLIGPPYYTTYKLVLKIVLLCVAFGLCVAGVVQLMTSPPAGAWYLEALEWLGTLWSGLLSAFGAVTLLFAFFHYKNIDLGNGFQLDELPPVPQKRQTISRGECIFDISFSILLLVLLLVAPQIFIVAVVDGNTVIPFFQAETLRSTWYILVAFFGAGIVRESVKLLEGQYNKKVMVVSVAVDIVSAALAFWWLLRDNLINPALVTSLSAIFTGNEAFLVSLFTNFQYYLLGLILLALVLDAGTAIAKALRS